eukprot:3295957-Prorocentrum_lima.AAC.1
MLGVEWAIALQRHMFLLIVLVPLESIPTILDVLRLRGKLHQPIMANLVLPMRRSSKSSL